MKNICVGYFIFIMLLAPVVFPVLGDLPEKITKTSVDEYPLPPPMTIEMLLEESICRRLSTRTFTSATVTDEDLSTILWAAYGVTADGNRSIYNPDGRYSTIIYVIRSDATYIYVPENHSLALFKSGNYLHLGQYTAPIKFGLVWDMDMETEELRGMADIGMVAQNIYFQANALDLGMVTTGMYVEELYDLGIPSNEKPEIIMPLGHPSSPYDFTYNPLPPANLPSVVNNTLCLAEAISHRKIITLWDDSLLTLQEQSEILWSAYGYSYLWDNVNNKRHRTLPSAIGYYPFKVFMANQSGVYQYLPSTHAVTEILLGDMREAIKNCIDYGTIILDTASMIIIPCWDTNSGSTQYQHFWYYENGAIIHNILLEASALNLSSNVIYDITDETGLRTALGITGQTNIIPLSVVPVGYPYTTPNTAPDKPDIDGQLQGKAGTAYSYRFTTIDPDGDDVYYYIRWGDGKTKDWDGPHISGEGVEFSHTYADQGIFIIEAKAKDSVGAESAWATLEVSMPLTKEIPLLLLYLCKRCPHVFQILQYFLSSS